jgi:murein DD-endopeptidase MepM/ murein hydrolase activator NlpD
MLVLSSFQFEDGITSDYIANAYNVDPVFVTDNDGYLLKSMPATTKGDYTNRNEIMTYEVQDGDTVSTIAYMFNLKVRTILENNQFLGAGNLLKVGQKIVILPIDGLKYDIQKGDNISSIAKKYSIKEDLIKTQNKIDKLIVGQSIILPGATLPRPIYIAQTAKSTKSGGAYVNIGKQILNVDPSNSGIINPVPVNGRFSRGTKGHGYRAVDISRSDKSWSPNVVAACIGTVSKVSLGYGGGYGNYIIINCDNDYNVLTAHHSDVYVKSGERVEQGQIIAKMGNTGKSSGVHTHFEVRDSNGIRLEPLNFISISGQP